MRDDPEHRLQVAVAKYLKYALPSEILWTSTLNGAYLTQRQRTKMAESGLRRGIPDIIITVPGRGVFMIELKSDKGTLSAEQKLYRDALQPLGRWALARSLEEVEAAITVFGIVPKVSLRNANRYSFDSVTTEGE